MENKTHGGVLVNIIGVLAVCVIIAAVLFPMFSHRRSGGCGQPLCVNNLQQIGKAMKCYLSDNNDSFPSSYLVRHSKKWNKRDFIDFTTKAGMLPLLEKDCRRTIWQAIYDYTGEREIMFCNVDTASHDGPNAKPSYWYKLALDKAWYGEGCTKACRSEADFGYHSSQVMFYENRARHSGKKGSLKNGVRINVAFMDGHVKYTNITNTTSGDPKTCAANSDGEPMYFNFGGCLKNT